MAHDPKSPSCKVTYDLVHKNHNCRDYFNQARIIAAGLDSKLIRGLNWRKAEIQSDPHTVHEIPSPLHCLALFCNLYC
jgi:hypothetical protein